MPRKDTLLSKAAESSVDAVGHAGFLVALGSRAQLACVCLCAALLLGLCLFTKLGVFSFHGLAEVDGSMEAYMQLITSQWNFDSRF